MVFWGFFVYVCGKTEDPQKETERKKGMAMALSFKVPLSSICTGLVPGPTEVTVREVSVAALEALEMRSLDGPDEA